MPNEELDSCYAKVFISDAGERVIEDLERLCEFTPNTQDSNDVFLRLGKMELLKHIKRKIIHNPIFVCR